MSFLFPYNTGTIKMQSSEKGRESQQNGAPENAQSQSKLSDSHLTFGSTEGIHYMPQPITCPASQSSGNEKSTSTGLNRPRIKKEFPNENGQEMKTWDSFRSLTIKQDPDIKQEPGIKMEPQDFNNGQQVQGRLVIDLTEEDSSSAQKRPMPRMELLMAVHEHQRALKKVTETAEEAAVESLFVQDDDSSPSTTPKTSDFLESSEDDVSGFNEYQKQFRSLQSPSMEQQIEFEKRRGEELERRRKVKLDKLVDLSVQAESEEGIESENISSGLEEHPQPGESQLNEPQPKEQTLADLESPATTKPPGTRLSKARIKKAKEIGLIQLLSKERAQNYAIANETQPGTEQSSRKRKQKQYPHPPTVLSKEEIRSIFKNDGSHKKGHDPLPPGFVSTEKNKQKAFREMIANIPVAERAGAREDISILNEATQTFNPSARSDGQGKWKVRGLKTNLMVNQILAASWMCKRETSLSKPNGGLLCDFMGFGKTLSALACIVNRKVPTESEGPTLIVAPRNLIPTWYGPSSELVILSLNTNLHRMSQIQQHCKPDAVGRAIVHCSGSRAETNDLDRYLKDQGIVLTTYQEISSSYPELKVPPELWTDEAVEEWWEKEYDEKVGAFHRINWHRIILDDYLYRRAPYQEQDDQNVGCSSCFKWELQMGLDWNTFAQVTTSLVYEIEEFKLTFEHSSVDELYALFSFVEVPNSHPYQVFMHNFCDGTPNTKNRLINMLRAIIHRKTHESRHMGRPLIELKRFDLKEVKVEFYPVEKQIYAAIAEIFIKKVNATQMSKQSKFILTMILKLQMFASHPLTAEDYLKRVCHFNSPLDIQLKGWVKDETSPGIPSPSGRIARSCLAGMYQTSMPIVPLSSRTENENLRPLPDGNLTNLVEAFKEKNKNLLEEGSFYELDHRTWFCPGCDGIPTRAIITDCNHLYCEECFDALPDKEGNTDGVDRKCHRCDISIRNAAFYGIYDDFDTPQLEDNESSSLGLAGQQKRPARSETGTANEVRTKKRRKGKHARQTFSEWLLTEENLITGDGEHESEDQMENEYGNGTGVPCEEVEQRQDWIAAFGKSMPGAKFDAITAQVNEWFEKDSTAKIVIFTQYVNSTRLLRCLCEVHDWKYSEMTGRMANRSREINLNRFRKDAETKIMIASIKTGGLGLDFSVANKCILIDLWWNEAVQDQAFFRLWRLGQQRDVECIMLTVKGSIDDWMDRTQKRKAKEISEVLSQRVLMDRNTLKELLEMFGDVTDDPKKGFRVHLASEDTSKNASNSAPEATPEAISRRKATRPVPPKKRS
ncbi:SNF2-related protein [Penicillium cf. griseofulvum]|uniref:SNF2-related protein n=1 Tax=Penicillium cf. griseofulvum TaxID=2972120 RepID=A0A9W9JMJ2_9EURO|nr:SNF2-related protein [Penicillium cf. griseofulvum]KAJ5424331.1 SNF2-related protein [Penicillium cf. griseofulvum]